MILNFKIQNHSMDIFLWFEKMLSKFSYFLFSYIIWWFEIFFRIQSNIFSFTPEKLHIFDNFNHSRSQENTNIFFDQKLFFIPNQTILQLVRHIIRNISLYSNNHKKWFQPKAYDIHTADVLLQRKSGVVDTRWDTARASNTCASPNVPKVHKPCTYVGTWV